MKEVFEYQVPEVEIMTIAVEQGFAASGDKEGTEGTGSDMGWG